MRRRDADIAGLAHSEPGGLLPEIVNVHITAQTPYPEDCVDEIDWDRRHSELPESLFLLEDEGRIDRVGRVLLGQDSGDRNF